MSDWEPEKNPESWGDTEAWRGDVHLEGDESWQNEEMTVWEDEESSSPEADEPQDSPLNDWPENLAGPEYWLYKRDEDS